jgi:hypothetical protein
MCCGVVDETKTGCKCVLLENPMERDALGDEDVCWRVF